jgi:oxygen-independent coproporphyrinogen-3 oxidase
MPNAESQLEANSHRRQKPTAGGLRQELFSQEPRARSQQPPFGLYIHIPFCRGKCAYCDFNSYPELEELHPAYLGALKMEAEQKRGDSISPVTSVYFGGGTPTIYGSEDLVAILGILRRTFSFDSRAEISVEANPETLNASKLLQLREGGFNRISMGFQSLDDRLLRILGRRHTAKEAVQAYNLAREAGFANINLDLIFGINGQSLAMWRRTLEKAVSLSPEHVSTYGLELKQEAGSLQEASENEQAEMYELAISLLTAEGYRHYEVSNFARESYECGHNLNYWRNGKYLGLGAGAHSYVGNRRYSNLESPLAYLSAVKQGGAVEKVSILTPREEMEEEIFLGLRTGEGVGLQEFTAKFGMSLERAFPGVSSELIRGGLLDLCEGRAKLSKRGLFLANEVLSRFV